MNKKNTTYRDTLWAGIWLFGMTLLWLWDFLFLNKPAFEQVQEGFLNTLIIAGCTILLSLLLGWLSGVALYFLEKQRFQVPYLIAGFFVNLLRSIPQIVGVLMGYVLITLMLEHRWITSEWSVLLLISFTISLFVFLELSDLVRERIAYFRQRDFFSAMLVCGIKESRIVNREVLWKNSLQHIFNKLISIFGVTIFLQCSVDFIVSVGLSSNVSSLNFPTTLGSLLAKIDSKQDILAISHTLWNPGYIGNLFFEHLQGVTVAFIIVFTLLCIYKIANGFAARHELA